MLEGEEGIRLSSVVQRTLWPVRRELVALCRRRHLPRWLRRDEEHLAPALGCQCGIYGARELEQVLPYLEPTPGEVRAGRVLERVLGRVLLWGQVVECSLGWRASHAYPERIYLYGGSGAGSRFEPDWLAFALASYGVPVELSACATQAELVKALAGEAQAA